MKKLSILLTVVVFSLVLISYTMSANAEKQNQETTIGVKNVEGQYVGTVSNALVGPSGNIIFVIVSLGDEMGQGKKDVVIPLDVLSYDSETKDLVVNLSREQLALAPEFNLSDLDDPGFAERINQFYGLAPAWEE